ncbi:MAG TPA: N-6 DNA methylase [Blastocatellia bacterium]|nr:N-6 DNA methylase [Blastocatellia bacterium]
MACARDDRHRYGQHYTPDNIARMLAALAIRQATDLVFDPSCGDGRLLLAARERKLELARGAAENNQAHHPKLSSQIFGIDRSADAIDKARITGASVFKSDFFHFQPHAPFPLVFDAIIGNPPYIRQEVMTRSDKSRVAKLLEMDRRCDPLIAWPRFSGRSDAYVFFFAHATRFLREGGRLAFLTSASWLDVGYGRPLREFLLRNFRILAVIESAVERFFGDASINTIVTVLERATDSDARNEHSVTFAQLLQPVGPNPAELVSEIDSLGHSRSSDALRIRIVKQAELESCSGGWGKYLRADDLFFNILRRGARLTPLKELARVRFGVKTGANEFFYVRPSDGRDIRLRPLGEVATVRRGLTTGANEFFYVKPTSPDGTDRAQAVSIESSAGGVHRIESHYLTPVVFSLKELPGIRINRPPGRKLFFNCQAPSVELRGTRALDYIRSGERAGYHLRPSCASRDPWYSVARGMTPAPLLFPSKVGERWLIALNEARVFEDKKLYGVFPHQSVDVTTLAALLNSTWARYYAEVTCRQMTGAQAIADIDVAVAEQILIPDPRVLPSSINQLLGAAVCEISARPVLVISEEVLLADRRKLDDLTLLAMGFESEAERRVLIEHLYSAVVELVDRRLAGSTNK